MNYTINLSMAVVLAVLYGVGFYLLMQRSLMRILIGIVVIGHGANLLLQLAGGPPGRAPIVDLFGLDEIADPLPQALALTAIVITFALTTYLLALGYRSWVLVGHDEVQDDVEDRRIAARSRPDGAMEEGTADETAAGPEDTSDSHELEESRSESHETGSHETGSHGNGRHGNGRHGNGRHGNGGERR